jgi:hypothetical protein
MKNITDIIQKSIHSDNNTWSIFEFFQTLQILNSYFFSITPPEDSENWAVLGSQNKIVGYVWKKYPLLIILESYSFKIRESLNAFSFIEFIETNDLTKKEFLIDLEKVKDFFFVNTNSELLSAEDLWFFG